MKKIVSILFVCSILVMLAACAKKTDSKQQDKQQETPKGTLEIVTDENAFKEEETKEEEAPVEEKVPEKPAVKEHSKLYDERYSVKQVIKYFKEVVLDVEYSSGDGDPSVVQKWEIPLRYEITGMESKQDKKVLKNFCKQLNQIEGFPGIEKANEDEVGNVFIGFYNYDEFYENMGEVVNYEDSDGAVQFWYGTETNDIYEMTIGYRTDIDQYVRNSVIMEEIINGLGITDTNLREDSIVYQGYTTPQELTDMDWLLLKILYHPDIKCGMNAKECAKVIRKIYY